MKTKILFPLLFVSVCAFSQTDSVWLKKNIYVGMDSMYRSFEKRDWNKFAGFMYPDVVKMTGGKESFAKMLEKQMNQLLSEARIDSIKTGNILQLINYKGQWQCVVESFMQMTVENMIVSTASSNIGVTYDNGKTWKFIRVTNGNETKVRELFPTLSPALKIPYNKTEVGKTLGEFLKTYHPQYPK